MQHNRLPESSSGLFPPVPWRRWRSNGALLGLTLALAACAGTAPPSGPSAASAPSSGAVIAPNPNLLVQGIPPIPAALAAQVEKYTDFRGHGFVTWHPTKPEMIVTHRAPGSSVTHLFRLARPMAPLEPLTEGPEPVSSAHYEPKEGRFLIYPRATGGNEVAQLYRLDLPSRQSRCSPIPTSATPSKPGSARAVASCSARCPWTARLGAAHAAPSAPCCAAWIR